MTTKVYVRFVNENQWVSLCEAAQEGASFELLDELMVEWSWADSEHPVQAPVTESFPQFASNLHQRWPHSYLYGIDLVISGAHTVGAEVNIPSRQMRHIAQALPYMIEDQLAQDVSQFHLIHSERRENGSLSVLALPRYLIEGTQRLFSEHQLPLDAILPDMLCLPHTPGEWTLLVDGKRLLIRQNEMSGISIEIDAVPVVLASILEHWQPHPSVLRILLCREQLNDNVKHWVQTRVSTILADSTIVVEYNDIASGLFVVLCDRLHSFVSRKHPGNFLQGAYATKGRRKPSAYNWKPLAALAATFVIAYTGFLYTQSWKFQSEYKRLEAEATTLYKRLFPADRRIVNLRRQMEQHIQDYQKSQGGASFLALLTVTGQQIQQMNRVSQNAITPQRASYDENQGDLRLDLLAKDFAQLEGLKTRLESSELVVETASAAQDAAGVKARLRIRSQRS